MRRLLLIVSGIVLLFFGFGANHIRSGNLLGLTNSRPAMDEVARRLGSSVYAGTGGKTEPSNIKDVEDRLSTAVTNSVREVNAHGYPAADLSLDDSHRSGDVYSFNVSAASATRYCLAVTVTGPVRFTFFMSGGGRRPDLYDYSIPVSSKVVDGQC